MNNNKMNNISNNNTNAMDMSNTTNTSTIMTTPDSRKREPEAIGGVYKAAARRLREYHGVPSMTAVYLQKTLALLQLHPRRLVAQGLAPSRLLRGESSPSLLEKNNLGQAKGEECEIAVAGKRLRDDDHDDSLDMDNFDNETETKKTEEEEDSKTSDDPESDKDASSTRDQNKGKANRPVHTALLAGGVHLRPRETDPLLRALGVSPHRLVRLGLVERGSLHAMPGGRGHGPHKHRRGGGCRAGGLGGPHCPPRPGSPDVPPHGPLGRGPPCGGTHGRLAPPRRGHGFFGDFGEQPHGEIEGEEEGMPIHGPSAPDHGPDRHCPRHRGGGNVGKAHRPPHGPPGLHGLEQGRMRPGPGRFGEHSHDEESGGEEIAPMHEGLAGSPQGHGHHGHHDGPIGHCHGPMHGHRGPRGRMHAPPRSPPAPPLPDHDRVGPICCGGGEAMLAPPSPGHHGSRTAGGEGGMPPHGPFHRLFHEGAVHAPHGRMERPGHGPPRPGGRMGRGGGMHGGGNFCGGGGVSLQPGRTGHRFCHEVHCGPHQQHQQGAY